MVLNEDILRLLDQSVLCWLATSSATGEPNVSPKEIFLPYNDDSIIIANVMSPNSARNLKANSKACVSFVNVFTQRGYQISGSAYCLSETDDGYSEIECELLKVTQGRFPFKSVFRVMAEQISEILAPRYRLFPETTEQSQIASAMLTYGVRPRDECNT